VRKLLWFTYFVLACFFALTCHFILSFGETGVQYGPQFGVNNLPITLLLVVVMTSGVVNRGKSFKKACGNDKWSCEHGDTGPRAILLPYPLTQGKLHEPTRVHYPFGNPL
jgi:hypothetical protein